MESEHSCGREMFVEYHHPADVKIVQAALALKMSGFEFTLRPAPRLGEHRIEILREAGLDGAATAIAGRGGRWRSESGQPASQGGFSGRP